MKPAIGLIELSSIARGLYVSDVMVKKAPVELLMSQTTSPGKYLILVSGDVASVQESTQAAIEQSENTLVDSLFIPNIQHQVISGLKRKFTKNKLNSVGIVETQSVASAILSLDSALKTASTDLVDMKLGKGLGGKGYFVLTGELSEVEAALNAAKLTLEDGDKFLRSDIIARPHEDFSVSVAL